MNLLDLEIYAWIARYLRGDATVDEFEDWFVPATWHVEHSGNLQAVEVAAPVRAALVELSAGEVSEADFKAELASLESRRKERIRFFQESLGAEGQAEPLSKTIIVGASAAE